LKIGNRIPHDYFITQGAGESDVTIHAGSYHLALRNAGIEMANIITYSSILPATATENTGPLHEITHGEVMETIMAVSHSETGQVATAGLIYGWLHGEDGTRYGGLVCEYNGNMEEALVRPHLRDMLAELHQNGYEQYQLTGVETFVQSIVPEKRYGTALIALCFTSYDIPELS
jgi:arginine decarboxylase